MGGWFVLNHEKYRGRLSKEDLREKARIRQQRRRDKQSVTQKRDASVTGRDMSRMSRHTDTDTDTEDHTHNTAAVAAARRVCVELSLAGEKNLIRVQEVIVSQGEGFEKTANMMLARWQQYRELESCDHAAFKYGSPVAFFERGAWLDVRSWPEAVTPKPANRVPVETDEQMEARLKAEGAARREEARAKREARARREAAAQ